MAQFVTILTTQLGHYYPKNLYSDLNQNKRLLNLILIAVLCSGLSISLDPESANKIQ